MAKDKVDIKRMIEELKALDTSKMYLNDFFHTWKESDDEIAAVFKVAEILRGLRENNISAKVFDSGLGISIFRQLKLQERLQEQFENPPYSLQEKYTWNLLQHHFCFLLF